MHKVNTLNLKSINYVFLSLFILLICLLSYKTIFTELPEDFQINPFIHFPFLKVKFSQHTNNSFIFEIIKFFIQFLFLLTPIIGITLMELSQISGKIGSRFSLTSIGKIRFSEGFKGSEVWFFFLPKILFRMPFLITLISFGLNNLSDPLKNSILSIYQKFLPFPTNVNAHMAFIFMLFYVLIIDFTNFLGHWLEHKIPIFWELHEFHHASTEMVILNQARGIPLMTVLRTIIFLPINVFALILFTTCINQGFYFPIFIYFTYTMIDYIAGYVGHSSLLFLYPKPLSYVLMSPSLHWIHHSDNETHYDKNFGSIFIFWDKLFGSYLDERHIKDITCFGVKNTQYNKYHPLYSYFVLPIVKIKRRLQSVF